MAKRNGGENGLVAQPTDETIRTRSIETAYFVLWEQNVGAALSDQFPISYIQEGASWEKLPLHGEVLLWSVAWTDAGTRALHLLPCYDTAFVADCPVENCQNAFTVTVTVVPSPYLDCLLTAVSRLQYGVQPYLATPC